MLQKTAFRPVMRLVAWALFAAALLSACGGAPAPTSAPGEAATAAPAAAAPTQAAAAPAALSRDPKTLVVAAASSPDNADPAQTLNAANSLLQRGMYEGLLTLKGGSLSEVEPVLAESFTTNDDKSTWTFKIRQGVKFTDGAPLDAQAVYDSYARIIVNKFPTWNILGRFVGEDPAKTMKVVDANTLEFNFGTPQPLFQLALAAAYGTGIVSPKAFKENAKNDDAGKEWLTTHAAGT
ncbi:MAG TPA: ABC transporter substrate-binding protein, partial [Roseiflexaceae bacterium]|nr:ABC transporter substrate-binding protein [Roseiflexaceae bacterium]